MPNSGLVVRAKVTRPEHSNLMNSSESTPYRWSRYSREPMRRGKVDCLATEVLDQERNPGERPVGESGGDRSAGAIDLQRDHGRDLRVCGSGAIQRRIEELVGGDLLRAHQCGESEGVVAAVFVMAHGRQT